MASDSDVEAYLNQLSRKTYSLKQDVQSWGYSSSHPSSAGDKPDDDLNLSDESGSPVRTDDQSSLKHKKEVTGSVSDIASYSKKHSGLGLKKTYPHDKFSSLEQKYLKKPSPSKYATGSKDFKGHKHGNASLQQREELKYDAQDSSDKKVPESTTKQKIDYSNYASSRSKTRVISDDSSVDEELARYLNETSLTDNQGDEFHANAQKPKTHSSSEDYDDSMDEVLNLNNILAVEDILDQVTDYGSRAHDDSKFESRGSGNSKNNSLIEKSETVVRDALPQKHNCTNPLVKDKITSSKSNSLQAKPLTSVKSNISQNSKQAKMHGTEKKDRNMLFSSRNSLFYSNTQQDDSDHDKPLGIFLAQSSTNVFHSSRRKSSIGFDSEGSVRPKTPKYSSKKKEMMVKSEVYSEEYVAESIASSSQRSIAESVVEGDQSTSAGVDKSVEENLAISVAESLSEDSQTLEKAKKDISEIISETEESIPLKANSQNIRKSIHDNFTKVKSPTKHSSRQKRSEPSHQSDICEPRDISDHKENTKESKRKSEKVRKNRHKRRKSKKRYRTSSSESSSSESLSDSERDWHRRHHSRSSRYKWKYAFKPWSEPPYIQPWFHPYHHPYASPAGIFSHSLGPTAVEGFVGFGGVVGVEQLMRQQVALTRQFLDSQQALYHAYTATLTSSYRYTSLSNTEKYIKKRKPPLTFSEAYKLVKEEMKASE